MTATVDLSARQRRGQLERAEQEQLEWVLGASREAALLHRAAGAIAAAGAPRVGDEIIVARIAARVLAAREAASPRPELRRKVVWLCLRGLAVTALLAAGAAAAGALGRPWVASPDVTSPTGLGHTGHGSPLVGGGIAECSSTPDAQGSFDFDCDGIEALCVALPVAGKCTLVDGRCTGAGLLPTARKGAGVNPYCGTTSVQACTPNSEGCIATKLALGGPIACR